MELTRTTRHFSDAQESRMPALTGIRFFAIFHIFLFHLWTLYDMEKPPEFANLLIGFADLPPLLVNFISNGWLATSFFFLLSGFILAYLYWGPDGRLSTDRKRFWLQRCFRIYPIHLLTLTITAVPLVGWHLSQGMGMTELIGSLILTLTLMQAWVPEAVPVWSWPTWTLSALIFLYLIMPWLMPRLARLSRRQMGWTLALLPFVSLIPTAIYALLVPVGTDPGVHWKIFLGSMPLFWLPHFMAGMLLTRLFHINRFTETSSAPAKAPWLSWGDLALVLVLLIAVQPTIAEPLKFFLRHGLVMPIYMVLLLDLARGRGLAARIFSFPGSGFLGETGFSIFVWQNLVMTACWISLNINPNAGHYHLVAATLGIVLLGILSTYGFEKPMAGKLRRKFL